MDRKLPKPLDEEYWDRDALIAEEKRVFEICNGCRLCWNLCPSFPALFNAVDALDETGVPSAEEVGDYDGSHGPHIAEVRDDVLGQADALDRLPLSVNQEVVDLCYQCKLCDPICPFTPPHEHAVDFPRLMLRHKAVDAREKGVTLQDQILGDPDRIGKLGTLVTPLANWASKNPVNRFLMEKTAGIHRNRQLPPFASETFRTWFQKRPAPPPPDQVEGKKVVLFYTCSVQWNEPQVGRAAVQVLERNGFTVYAPEFRCCGMPALDGGDVPRATRWAEQNLQVLAPYVDAGCQIVIPGPTCSYMMKHEWSDYTGSELADRVAEVSFDLMEFLWNLRRAKALDQDYTAGLGKVSYHVPCHLKVQKIGFRSRDVLKKIPDTQVQLVDRCSCMDGTWGMKTEYYEISKKWAGKLLDELVEDEPDQLSSDCLIAKLQIEENTGRKVEHPIVLMARAYGIEV